jgi:hypothetical protein
MGCCGYMVNMRMGEPATEIVTMLGADGPGNLARNTNRGRASGAGQSGCVWRLHDAAGRVES